MANCNRQQLNITCGTDVVLHDRLIFDGETFDPNLSVGIAANLVSSLGKRTALDVQVVDDELLISVPWIDGTLPGCYGLEVTGSCNSKKWATYADSLIRYTKATVPGASEVTVESDTYDITQEVGYCYSNSPVTFAEVTVDDGYGTPSVDVTYEQRVLSMAFHNLKGNGITDIDVDEQVGDEAVNTVTIKTDADQEGTEFQVRNGSRGNGITSSSEVLSDQDGGINTFTITDDDGNTHEFHSKNGTKGATGDTGIYNPDAPDAPDFEMATTTGQSTTKAMTQKAVTDELESLNSEVESIKYKSELLFENSDQIAWQTGNISNGKIVTTYANKYFILDKPSYITDVVVTKGESTFTLALYGSSDNTNYTRVQASPITGTSDRLNVENYTKLLFLLWDKPSVSDAQAVPITMVGFRVVVPIESKQLVSYLTDGGEDNVQNAESIKVLSESTYFETLTAGNGYMWYQGGIRGSDGADVVNAKAIRSSWIPVGKYDEIVIKKNGLSNYTLQGVLYNSDKTFVRSAGEGILRVKHYTSSLATERGFLRLSFYSSSETIDPSDAQPNSAVVIKPKANEQIKYYHNPVIRADYPDPTVWYGEDGYYYLYATGGVASKTLLRSSNLIDWEDTGEIPFTANAISALASAGIDGSFWAPCVKKMSNGKWNMYISKPSGGVAILTSDYPSFGYEFVKFTTASIQDYIDPDIAVERDNTVWMFAGAYYGIYRRQMTPDGLDFAEGSEWVHVAGRPGIESGNTNRIKTFEGEYLYRRKGYWYLFCSSGVYSNNTYAVRVVRSQTLNGVFVDKEGNAATDGYAEYVIQSNTCVYGPGHNGQIFVDKENRTWMLYHAHWEGFPSTSTRGVCIDEILWDEDGWPYVEDGTPSLSNVAPKM